MEALSDQAASKGLEKPSQAAIELEKQRMEARMGAPYTACGASSVSSAGQTPPPATVAPLPQPGPPPQTPAVVGKPAAIKQEAAGHPPSTTKGL
eukprot:2305184-Pyramimonas_sp.AAC.1